MEENYNPLAPATSPEAAQLFNAYQAHIASIRGEVQTETKDDNGYNPFAPQEDTQEDKQQAHISNMEQFLSPVPMNQYDVESSHTDEKKQVFHDHFINDPAIKEFGEDYVEKLEVIRQALMNGQIDESSAIQMIQSYGENVIDPILDKHHGKHSDTHKISFHDEAHAAFLKGGK
ncbi:hypothetical protein QUR06_000265 [Escherichia coli]|nr:hypothetical protein [Escherichia coli]